MQPFKQVVKIYFETMTMSNLTCLGQYLKAKISLFKSIERSLKYNAPSQWEKWVFFVVGGCGIFAVLAHFLFNGIY